MPRFELWSLGPTIGPPLPGFVRRACVTRQFGRVVRQDPLPDGVAPWGWVRADRPVAGLLGPHPGAVADLELATWRGDFDPGDAGSLLDVTTHGWPVARYRSGLADLAARGGHVYPQLYQPSRPTMTAAAFAHKALDKWADLGYAPDQVCGLVSAGDGAYGRLVASTLIQAGAGVAIWTWAAKPTKDAQDMAAFVSRLAFPV